MDPDISAFEAALPGGPFTWIVFCLDEEGPVGGFFGNRIEAEAAATVHSVNTGHAAKAAPVLPVGGAPLDTAEQLISTPFCISFDGRPAWTIVVAAPGPEEGLVTVEQFVALLNQAAPSLGFPPLFSASLGACPPA